MLKPERIVCAGRSAFAEQGHDGRWYCSHCRRPVRIAPVQTPPLLIRSGMPFTPRERIIRAERLAAFDVARSGAPRSQNREDVSPTWGTEA